MAIGKDMVTVVVPTFNEEEAVGMVLDEATEDGLWLLKVFAVNL